MAPLWKLLMVAPFVHMERGTLNCVSGGTGLAGTLLQLRSRRNLLCADFLCAHGLLVDVKNRRLIDMSRFVPMRARSVGLTPYDACFPP